MSDKSLLVERLQSANYELAAVAAELQNQAICRDTVQRVRGELAAIAAALTAQQPEQESREDWEAVLGDHNIPQQPQEFFWVVEYSDERNTYYWTGVTDKENRYWVYDIDIMKAVHFPSKEAAKKAHLKYLLDFDYMGDYEDGVPISDYRRRVEQHAVIRAAQQPQEAVATVEVGPHDHGPFVFRETPYGADRLCTGTHKLYTAPPSGVREGMLRAAEVCNKHADMLTDEARRAISENRDVTANLLYGKADAVKDAGRAITRAAEQVNAEGRATAGASQDTLGEVVAIEDSKPASSAPSSTPADDGVVVPEFRLPEEMPAALVEVMKNPPQPTQHEDESDWYLRWWSALLAAAKEPR